MSLPALSSVRGVIFDLDGTLYQDGALIEGALETVAALRKQELPVRFLTNTTSKSRAQVVEKLRRLGFDAEPDDIFSPPAAAGAFLRAREASALLLVQPGALPDFSGVPQDDERPEYIVVGDLGAAWTFDRLNRAFQRLHGGARLIGLGRTRYWHTDGGLQLDAGPFVAALEYASGQDAIVLGKPAAAFFELALGSLGLPAEHVALVGDDIRTDVGAAMAVGVRGVLVRTGKFRPSDLDGDITPDLVLDSVADLIAQRTL